MNGNEAHLKKDKATSEHYAWKDVCDGWHFVKNQNLSVIIEKMPPNTAEDMHYHTQARQFFYVLSGVACMTLENEEIDLQTGEGIEINPMQHHQMKNCSECTVEFMVVSSPKSPGDRVNVCNHCKKQ
jgi:mannose-6-phosphate isomerase-like protein (cupin superfamily)